MFENLFPNEETLIEQIQILTLEALKKDLDYDLTKFNSLKKENPLLVNALSRKIISEHNEIMDSMQKEYPFSLDACWQGYRQFPRVIPLLLQDYLTDMNSLSDLNLAEIYKNNFEKRLQSEGRWRYACDIQKEGYSLVNPPTPSQIEGLEIYEFKRSEELALKVHSTDTIKTLWDLREERAPRLKISLQSLINC